jgi:hypothetical protein
MAHNDVVDMTWRIRQQAVDSPAFMAGLVDGHVELRATMDAYDRQLELADELDPDPGPQSFWYDRFQWLMRQPQPPDVPLVRPGEFYLAGYAHARARYEPKWEPRWTRARGRLASLLHELGDLVDP